MFIVKEEGFLTESDKLNGIEWKGKINVYAVAHRKYDPHWGGWQNWQDGVPKYSIVTPLLGGTSLLDIYFQKKKGHWSTDDIDPAEVKPDCSEIPPG